MPEILNSLQINHPETSFHIIEELDLHIAFMSLTEVGPLVFQKFFHMVWRILDLLILVLVVLHLHCSYVTVVHFSLVGLRDVSSLELFV